MSDEAAPVDSLSRVLARRGPLSLILVPVVLFGSVFGARMSGGMFDFLTGPLALAAGLLGVLAIALPGAWRLLSAGPAAALAIGALNWARIAALNVDNPCAPTCYVGEPCPPTSAECLGALLASSGLSARGYGLLMLIAVAPVTVGLALEAASGRRWRVALSVVGLLAVWLPTIAFLLVAMGSPLGGTPGPWLQRR